MHRILDRQIKKFLSPEGPFPQGWEAFLNAISETYTHFDEDRVLVERSLEISSHELTQKNRQIQASQDMLKKAHKIAHLGTWEWDVVHNIFTLSDEVYEILGFHEKPNKPTFDLLMESIDPDDRTNVSQAFKEALEQKKPFAYETRIIRNDKEKRVILVQGEVIENLGGKVVKVIGTTLDITQTKQKELQLNESQEKMVVRQEELERLNNLMIGRELKMVELKRIIEELKKEVIRLQSQEDKTSQAQDKII